MCKMEKINWSKDFNIGIAEIDLQHEYFVLLINRLIDELRLSSDKQYCYSLLEELAGYASFHFLSEENIMYKHNYPSLDEHKRIHRHLLNQLNERINFFKISKDTEEAIIKFLLKWFMHHTMETDQKFGRSLNRRDQDDR